MNKIEALKAEKDGLEIKSDIARFARLVRDVRAIEAAIGDGRKRVYETEIPIMNKGDPLTKWNVNFNSLQRSTFSSVLFNFAIIIPLILNQM